MSSKILILALALMAPLILGFDACDITQIPVGEEQATIEQAWDYDPKNLKEHVQRLELVAQLQDRMIAAQAATLYERAWFFDCMGVLMDPDVAPNTSQFNVYASMVDWCKANYGG